MIHLLLLTTKLEGWRKPKNKAGRSWISRRRRSDSSENIWDYVLFLIGTVSKVTAETGGGSAIFQRVNETGESPNEEQQQQQLIAMNSDHDEQNANESSVRFLIPNLGVGQIKRLD